MSEIKIPISMVDEIKNMLRLSGHDSVNEYIEDAMQIKMDLDSKKFEKRKLIGVIKNNKLVGLYHSMRYCPKLFKELKKSNGEIHTINRNIKKSHSCYCRFCIYLEAEEQGINCFDICPQKVCLENRSPIQRKID